MKRLTLMRHANAAAPSGEDFNRPLDAQGRLDAQAMGRALAASNTRFEAVLASPAKRVVETLDTIAEGLGWPLEPTFEEPLYLASAGALLARIQEARPSWDRLLIVGHNPAIATLAAMLSGERMSDFPPGAVAEIDLGIGSWRDAGKHAGKLVRFLRPSNL